MSIPQKFKLSSLPTLISKHNDNHWALNYKTYSHVFLWNPVWSAPRATYNLEEADQLAKIFKTDHFLYGHVFSFLFFFFTVHIFTRAKYENHVLCYNFSCVNLCKIRICHLLHLFIRYTMYHIFVLKIGVSKEH